MADMEKRSKAGKMLLDRTIPIVDRNTILYRGMWSGSVVPEKAVDQLPFLKRVASKILMEIFDGHFIEKSRQPISTFSSDPKVKTRTPSFLYGRFITLSKTHWLLRTIFRAIMGEVINPRWEIVARFKNRCTNCGKEHERPEIDECEICGEKNFDTPDIDQYRTFADLLKKPGQDRTFVEFIRSTLWYDLALDDFYWEIGYTQKLNEDGQVVNVPRAIRVLDGAITKPVMDKFGNFNSPQYFCPICYAELQRSKNADVHVDINQYRDRDPSTLRCETCGGPLVRTGYVQELGGELGPGKVVARWAEDEVVHASSSRVDPEAFGLSKLIACVKLLYIIDYMDEYNLQIYSHGHANTIIAIPGADKDKIEEIQAYVGNQIRSKTRRDVRHGETEFSLEPVMIFLGTEKGEQPIPIPIMTPLGDMQSIDYYRLYVEKVCGLFGVVPTFVSVSGDGDNATPRMEIDVQNRVTRGYMKDIEDPFNDQLLPKLGITDWILTFGKVESRDLLRDAQIKQTNAMAIALFYDKGFDVEVSENGMDYTVSPKPVREPVPSSRLGEGKIPQDQDGAARRTMPGGRGDGVPIQEPEEE